MNELKVGLMAIATIVAIAYMSLKVTSNQSGFGDYVTYRTIVGDASGIFPKTPIKVAGINSGRIKNIELQGNAALITFEVLKKVKVTVGSVLHIKSVGFLGDKYLEIAVNEASDTMMEEQGLITASVGGGIESLTTDAASILKDIKLIVGDLKKDLAPRNGVSPFGSMIKDGSETLDNLNLVTQSLKDLLVGNEEKLNEAATNLNEFSKSINNSFDINNKQSLMSDAKRIMSNIDRMSRDLETIANNIKNGQGSIGKFLSEDDIADEVKETLSSVKKIVKRVDTIRTELALFTGVDSNAGGKTGLGLRIYPSPERFYDLGITTSEFGVTDEKQTVTTVGGVETIENEKITEKDAYRLNIQIGRKIQNFVFRGGLIESTGGFGVDFERQDWGTKFNLETFDYGSTNGFNLRIGSEIHLWNVFYGKLAGQNIINDSRSLTISMGIRFLDEDLKGLLGFMF